MTDAQESVTDENEVRELPPEPTFDMASGLPEGLGSLASAGVGAVVDGDEVVEACTPALEEMEPSLHHCWGSPNEGPLADAISAVAPSFGDEINFPSSRNSPDMPGSSSVHISRWEPREVESPCSGHSNHCSVYPGASNRTSAAGGLEPRCLVRSNERKVGLDTGDVVMLMRQGRPYVTIQARLPYKADAWHTCLELTEEGVSPESEGLTYLEVIKQGPFVGFRSGAAGNRFVQPRRKPPHGLVFFNHNCGVWEQWDVLGEEWRSTPWSALPIVFQSRRMPQIQLSVDVVRVGFFSAPGSSGGGASAPFAPTPRSLLLPIIPEEDGCVEDKNLTRMSNLLIMEWFNFVDHEKLVREGVEADVTALKEDLTELKFNAIGQIEFLRAQMNDEMETLRQQVWDRDQALYVTHGGLRRVQQLAADRMSRARLHRVVLAWRFVVDDIVYCKAAVIKLTRKRQRELRDQVFWCWHRHVRAAVGRSAKLRFAVQRRAHGLMSKALLSWQQVAAHQAWRGRAMVAAVQRRAARALAGAFSSWRLEAVQRAAGRDALQRALQGVRRAELAAALMAWRAAAWAVRRQEVQAALMCSRRAARTKAAVLAGWRDESFLSRFLTRYARTALTRRALTAWREAREAAQARQHAAAAVVAAAPAALQRCTLRAWRDVVAYRIGVRTRLGRYVVGRSRGLLARTLAAWGRCVRERRVRRVVLQRHLAAVRQRGAAAVLAAWRLRAGRRAWQRSRLMMALQRAAAKRMSVALSLWRAYAFAHRATARRGELVAARVRRLRLAAWLGRWRQLAARLQLARQKLAALCKKLLGCTLSSAFREWRLLTRTAGAFRVAAVRALPPTTRDLLVRFLCMWWARHCGEPRSLAAATIPISTATPGYARRGTASSQPEPPSPFEATQRLGGQGPGPTSLASWPSHTPAHSAASYSPQAASSLPSRRIAAAASAGGVSSAGSAPPYPHEPLQPHGAVAFVGFPSPIKLASPSPAGPTVGSTTNSPARPPLHPAGPTAGLPRSPSSADASPTPSHTAELSHTDELNGGASGGHTTFTILSTPTRLSVRSDREALVTGGGSVDGASPTTTSAIMMSSSPAGGPPSSAPRIRASGSGMQVSAGGSASGPSSAPFVPAKTAVIGAGSSPVLVEMAPGRGGEGPLTPIGLPELLNGGEGSEEPLSLSGEGSAAAADTLGRSAPDDEATLGAATALSLSPDGSPLSAGPAGSAVYSSGAALPYAYAGSRSLAGEPGVEKEDGSEENPPGSVAPALSTSTTSCRRGGSVGGSGLGRWLAAAVLTSWRQAVADRRQWVSALEGVAAAQRRQLEGWVLACWRAAVAAAWDRATAAEVLAAGAVARSSRLRLREALLYWHVVARNRAAMSALLGRHKARTALAMTTRVLIAWQHEAAASASTKRKVARFASRLSADSLERSFRAWLDEASQSAARRAAAVQLASSHRRDLLHIALAGWCGATADRRARATRQARAARVAQRRRLQGAFSHWRWAAEAASERAAAVAVASRASALRAAFGSWRKMTSSGGVGAVDPDAALQRAAVWHSRRALRGCLAALREHKDQQLDLWRHAAAWSDAKGRAAVLGCWRVEAVEARRARLEVAKMQARSSRRLLSRSFDAWMAVVGDMCTARRMAKALGTRAEARLLADVVGGWRVLVVAAAEKTRRRSALELAARMRVRAVVLSHVFAGWLAAVERSAGLRAQSDLRFTAYRRALLSLAFAGWADATERNRTARSTAAARGATADRFLLREVLAGWAGQVAAARERAAAAGAFRARRAAVVLPAVLRSWAVLACDTGARRLQRSALAHLVLRRCMALQRRAFGAWRAALLERHARDDELRRCIKRKKLAFNQFKQWYWEAFDADVQATIRRMFHSTDPAAHSPVPSLCAPYVPSSAAGPYQQQPFGRAALGGRPWVQPQRQRGVTGPYAAAYGGDYGGRSSDYPPYDAPADAVDPTSTYRNRSVNPVPAHGPAGPASHASNLQHRLQQFQAQQQQQQQLARPLRQVVSYQPPQPQQREPIRTLAPAFDALARNQQAAMVRSKAAAPAAEPVQPVVHGRSSLRSSYPVLRPSESGSDDVKGEVEERGAGPGPGAGGRVAAAPTARRKEVSAFGRTLPAAKASRALPAGARSLAGGDAPGRRSGSSGSVPPRPTAPLSARDASAVGGGTVAGSSGLEAVAAMNAVTAVNAVLVNVASQLTEVSRASLEIAAGVVASGGNGVGIGVGLPPNNRPYRATTGSIGVADGGAYSLGGYPVRGSMDGSQVSSVGTGTHRSSPPAAPRGLGGSLGAAAVQGSLSPLSPAGNPLVPYGNMNGNSTASGGAAAGSGVNLPGVVPSWRQVATNQLYEAGDDWYGGDGLGPVDPMYVGIAGAGALGAPESHDGGGVEALLPACFSEGEAALGDGSEGPTRHRALSSATGLVAGGSYTFRDSFDHDAFPVFRGSGTGGGPVAEGLVVVGGGGGSYAGSRAASESNCFPPHSTYQNAAYRQQEDGEDEEEGEEEAIIEDRPARA